MREFASIWKWTVEERKGIFTPSPERGALKLNERPPPIPVKQHLLLIKVCVIMCNTAVCLLVHTCMYMYTVGPFMGTCIIVYVFCVPLSISIHYNYYYYVVTRFTVFV